MITGPHDPSIISYMDIHVQFMAYDRQRVKRISDRTAVTNMIYPA